MLEKLRATAEVLKGTLEGHLFKEHHIRLSDNLINETLKANLEKISVATGNDFRRLEIQSCPDYVTISGRATRKLVAADFSLRVLLDPVWEEITPGDGAVTGTVPLRKKGLKEIPMGLLERYGQVDIT